MNSAMPAELPPSMRRLSARLAAACLVLIIILPLAVAAYWGVADAGSLAVRANLPPGAMNGPLASWQRAAGGAATELPLCLLLVGLWHARHCFVQFAAGYVFTAAAMTDLRRFAGWAMASAGADIVCRALVSMLITLQNAPGQRQLAIGIGSDQILLLLFAFMVWLMAAVIGAGRALADENAGFV